jgi:hypothetical protein
MQKITTFLWFDGQAEEAVNYCAGRVMKAMRGLLCVLVLCFLCTNAHAQTLDSLNVGTRIRLQAKDTSGTFVIEEIQPDHLVVRSVSGHTSKIVRRGEIEMLETAQPLSRGLGAKRGLGIGIGVGVVGGILSGLIEGDDESTGWGGTGITAEGKALGNSIVLGGVGALVGGVVGMIWPGTTWKEVDLKKQGRIEWRLKTAQGLGAELSLAF